MTKKAKDVPPTIEERVDALEQEITHIHEALATSGHPVQKPVEASDDTEE